MAFLYNSLNPDMRCQSMPTLWTPQVVYMHPNRNPLAPHEASMEINDHYTQLARKDLSQQGVFVGPREQGGGPGGGGGGGGGEGGMQPEDLRAQLLTLKQQQHIQQQMLLQKFHEQQVRLAAEHEKQIQEHVKVKRSHMVLMAQKQQQEMFEAQQQQLHEQQVMEKERHEIEKLQLIKNKNKNEQSAVASSAVKMKLQEFVLNKKHRESHGGSLSNSPPQFRHWSAQHRSLDQHSPPQSGLSPPYRPHQVLGQYEKDFPLRKTVSDSNLKVRVKLKEKVAQRSSPLLRRKDLAGAKRKTPLSIDTGACHSNPDSGPNTPPSGTLLNPSDQQTPPREENGRPFPLQMMSKMVINHSMPNISIGNPRDSPGCQDPSRTKSSSGLTEAELHARGALPPHGVPLTSHMMHGSLQFYPSLPVIDSEMTPPTSPAYITAQMKTLEQGSTGKLASASGVAAMHHGVPYTVPNNGSPITDAQAAHARLHRYAVRPLNRTHSAPLPLGPPLLPQSGLLLHQQEQLIKENQKLYLKQRLQSTVLNRSNNSKNHMENMEEELESRFAQESEEDVVIIDEQSPPSPPHRPAHFHSRSFNQQRELVRQHAVQSESPPAPGVRPPLERAQSSPVVMAPPLSPPQNVPQDITMKCIDATGIAYDPVMLKHGCVCGNNSGHPEHAGRLQSIWARLHETGLVKRCERVKSRKATIDELKLVHDEVYALVYGTNSLNRPKLAPHILETLPSRFCLLPCGGVGVDSDTVWHDIHTSQAARMATGCVIELAYRVAVGDLRNGFAIVRPPGHHAEENQAMGFCFFNSVAIATKVLQQKLNMKRILIFDWDVHHGNSTQQAFYKDPGVLYLSMHRHDKGNFFPGTGAPEEVGMDAGTGFNVNVAFSGSLNPPMGDAEYLAAFRTIVMPIAREYNPEIVIVSAGFDAAAGHPAPLGGYKVSSEMFGFMTKELMTMTQGKLVLVLEGGYDLPSICDSAEICIQALLGDEISMLKDDQLRKPPADCAVEDLKHVMEVQANHWPCVTKYTNSVKLSLYEAQRDRDEADTLSAFASLSVVQENSPGRPERRLSNDEPVNVTEIVPVEEDEEEAERMEES